MTERAFKRWLRGNREEAIAAVLRNFVSGCHDDGPEEIARVLTVWATNYDRRSYPYLDLGDDDAICGHACHYGMIPASQRRRRS